jgi:hypothetical protein
VDVAESLAEVGLSDEAMILAREAAERRLRERFFLALDDVAFTRSVALLPPAERPDALLRLRKLASETSMPWQCITLSIVGAALHRLGRPEGLACTREALRLSRQALRWVLLSILQEDATVVADLDRGKTLRRVHQSLREIDQWWVDPAESWGDSLVEDNEQIRFPTAPEEALTDRRIGYLKPRVELDLVAQDTWLTHAPSMAYGFTRRWGHAIRAWAPWAAGFVWYSQRERRERPLFSSTTDARRTFSRR